MKKAFSLFAAVVFAFLSAAAVSGCNGDETSAPELSQIVSDISVYPDNTSPGDSESTVSEDVSFDGSVPEGYVYLPEGLEAHDSRIRNKAVSEVLEDMPVYTLYSAGPWYPLVWNTCDMNPQTDCGTKGESEFTGTYYSGIILDILKSRGDKRFKDEYDIYSHYWGRDEYENYPDLREYMFRFRTEPEICTLISEFGITRAEFTAARDAGGYDYAYMFPDRVIDVLFSGDAGLIADTFANPLYLRSDSLVLDVRGITSFDTYAIRNLGLTEREICDYLDTLKEHMSDSEYEYWLRGLDFGGIDGLLKHVSASFADNDVNDKPYTDPELESLWKQLEGVYTYEMEAMSFRIADDGRLMLDGGYWETGASKYDNFVVGVESCKGKIYTLIMFAPGGNTAEGGYNNEFNYTLYLDLTNIAGKTFKSPYKMNGDDSTPVVFEYYGRSWTEAYKQYCKVHGY